MQTKGTSEKTYYTAALLVLGTAVLLAVLVANTMPLAVITASILEHSGHPDAAMTVLNTELKFNSKNAAALRQRGQLYGVLRKNREALDDYNEALKLAPFNPLFLAERGEILLKLHEEKKAYEDFQQVGSLDPKQAIPFHRRAYGVHNTDGVPADAVTLENIAIAIDPTVPKYYNNRALGYINSGNYQAGVDDCLKGLSCHEGLNDVVREKGEEPAVKTLLLENLASAYLGLGQYDKARASAEQAIQWALKHYDEKPESLSDLPYVYRILALTGAKDYQAALKAIENAQQKLPENSKLMALKALSLKALNRPEEARAAAPQEEDARVEGRDQFSDMTETSLEAGNLPQALQFSELANLASPDDTYAVLLRAKVLYRMKQYDRCLADITRAIDLSGSVDSHQTGKALYLKHQTLKEMGRNEEALTALDESRKLGFKPPPRQVPIFY